MGAPATDSSDADALVGPAVALVRSWARTSERSLSRAERRERERFADLTGDPGSVAFTMSFADRVLRPRSDDVAARQLRRVVRGASPAFLSPLDRGLLRSGARLSRRLPGTVMSLARRRLRQIVGDLVVDRADPTLARHLSRSADEGFGVNVNLLGESVLGEREARRRLAATIDLLERPDVSYVSVKASAVTSQLNLWAYEDSLARVTNGLRPILQAAAAHTPAKFVNLDMEEYKDLRLTVDAFTALLDEPGLHSIEAGIVLQAYLPDSFDALVHLVGWATERRRRGGAGIKVRVVKGANLAMEKVDAAMHGWTQAPFDTKASTDANYKRMLDWAMQPDRVAAARIGVASHNLFDVAWAKLLADVRGVTDRVEFEMLQGMAPGEARTVRDATGALLLYTPVVAADDFDTALAYLFRRLEENSSGDNFLRHAFDLAGDAAAFAGEQARFELAVADRWAVSSAPRRRNAPSGRGSNGFANQPDTDPLDDDERSRIIAALASPPMPDLPAEVTAAGIDEIVARARRGAGRWRTVDPAERRAVLLRVGDELQARRAELVAVMADEAAKTVAEGDTEVSEAVDFARYYARHLPELDRARGDGAGFEPFGVCAVIPPWNFPVAIPAGGVVAALAAGSSVVLKPAPETPRCAAVLAEACWSAGVPEGVLQFVRCPDDAVGEHLVSHGGVDAIILTGAYETAELFARLAPATALFAETSGKNAIVVMPDADLDLAVADLVRSAFGHGGQKCSAASLAICVGDVARSERFRRQLVDATQSLVVAPSVRPEATMGPLIGEPSAKLRRALTELERGQRWLLAPRSLDDHEHLWSPGILEGVESGSWFHRNECFGPVLGLMDATDLDRALELQNEVAFGLTGGIHTLDEANVEHWLARVQVGNAYVNRAITGAVVQRQPFGGWKRSVVGPGAKAGGPNYVAQLGRWTDGADPDLGQDPSPRIEALVASLSSALDESGRHRLRAAARSDAHWWRVEFNVEHDPTDLFCEANVFRYQPLPAVVVRIGPGAEPADAARVLVAAARTGSPIDLSVDPSYRGSLGGLEHRREVTDEFALHVGVERPERVRILGGDRFGDGDLTVATHFDASPVVANGRIELARFLREQSISRTLHRFGNTVLDRAR